MDEAILEESLTEGDDDRGAEELDETDQGEADGDFVFGEDGLYGDVGALRLRVLADASWRREMGSAVPVE